MKRLFVTSLGFNLLARVIHLVTGVLSARLLGPYGRGELADANRWTSLFTLLFTIGLPGAVIFLGKRFPERQKEYFGSYLVLGSVIGIVGLSVGELVIPELFARQPADVIRLVQISMLSLPFGVVSDGLIGTLQSRNRFSQVMVLRTVGELGTLFLIVGLIWAGTYGVGTFIIGNTLWAFGTFVIALVLSVKAVHPSVKHLMRNNVFLVRKGVKIYATALSTTLGGNLDQLVISLLLTPYALGLYSVATSIGGIIPSLLSGAIGVYLWPKLMDMTVSERIHRIERIHSSLFYGSLAVCLAAGLAVPLLLPLMYGMRYAPALLVTEIFLFSAPINMAYMVMTYLHSTNDRFHVITVAEIVGLFFGLIVTIPLLKMWGGPGAAIGVLVAISSKWAWATAYARRDGISVTRLLMPYTDVLLLAYRKAFQITRNFSFVMRLTRWAKR